MLHRFARSSTPPQPHHQSKHQRRHQQQQYSGSRRRRVLVAVTLLAAVCFFLWLRHASAIPFADRSKACSIKEFRDKRVGFDSIDQASQRSLTTWRKPCSSLRPPAAQSSSVKQKTVRIGFLHWEYDHSEVRREYRVTDSQAMPIIANNAACNQYCDISVIRNADLLLPNDNLHGLDLVMMSGTDHGRAFGPTWCAHAYPFDATPPTTDDHHTLLWGAWTFEHLQQFPQIADPVLLSRLDMQMNYHPQSAVPITWFCPREINPEWDYQAYFRPPPPTVARQHLVAAVASRCRNDWQAYVNELRLHLLVRTYGQCWGGHNAHIPASDGEGMFASKVRELAKSKFTLVFENSKDISYYVSEKLSHALLAGTVPVVWGAPNIADYLPGPHSAVVVSGNAEFEADPSALAKHLLWLSNNDTAYEEYFAWKKSPAARERMQHLTSLCYLDAGCRLCEWTRQRRQQQCGGGSL